MWERKPPNNRNFNENPLQKKSQILKTFDGDEYTVEQMKATLDDMSKQHPELAMSLQSAGRGKWVIVGYPLNPINITVQKAWNKLTPAERSLIFTEVLEDYISPRTGFYMTIPKLDSLTHRLFARGKAKYISRTDKEAKSKYFQKRFVYHAYRKRYAVRYAKKCWLELPKELKSFFRKHRQVFMDFIFVVKYPQRKKKKSTEKGKKKISAKAKVIPKKPKIAKIKSERKKATPTKTK